MWKTIQKHWGLIIVWGLIFALLAGGASLFLPKSYGAESQVLIISRDRSGVDPYTQSKAAQLIGENLAAVMKTSDFFSKVISGSADFNRADWKKLSERAQRKTWNKNVSGNVLYGTSILEITVLADNQTDALALSRAVTQTLAERGAEYVGGDVSLKVVNSSFGVSTYPVRPNYLANLGLGFILGLVLAAVWVGRYKKHLFGI